MAVTKPTGIIDCCSWTTYIGGIRLVCLLSKGHAGEHCCGIPVASHS